MFGKLEYCLIQKVLLNTVSIITSLKNYQKIYFLDLFNNPHMINKQAYL